MAIEEIKVWTLVVLALVGAITSFAIAVYSKLEDLRIQKEQTEKELNKMNK